MEKPIKILITGYFNSGKSTLIRSLDENAILIEKKMKNAFSEEKTETTTGFDLGRVIWVRPNLENNTIGTVLSESEYEKSKDNFSSWNIRSIELKGVPGKMQFSIIREILSKGCDGVFFLIDGSNIDDFQNVLDALEETKTFLDANVPMFIIANKSDRDGYQGCVKISELVGEEAIEGSGKTQKGIKEAIILISKLILEEKN